MSCAEVISVIKDGLIACAAFTTSIVAWKGLQNWNRELKGKAEFEVARSLIRATYKLRDQVHRCRNPFTSNSEFPEGYRGGVSRSSPEEEGDAWGHVFRQRWEPVWNSLQEYDASTLEAEALWGSSIRTKTDELRQCLNELRAAIDGYLSDKYAGGEDFKADRDLGLEIKSIVFYRSLDKRKDKFAEKMSNAINSIEGDLRPHLKRS